jgi:hypothetical protein
VALAHANETSTLNSTVRGLGMGDAFTAVADDDSSLFYNPAGLARVRGLNWKIFDLDAGTSGVSAYSKIKNLNGGSGSNFANSIDSLYGEHVWVGAGGESIFTMPMLGVGVYDHASTLIQINNPVYPQVHTRIINDYGYIMCAGVPLSPFLHVGADLKYIKRTGSDLTAGPSFLADLQSSKITDDLTGWGVGYGADLGATFILPAPFFSAAFSAAWKNVGGMTFKSNSGTDIPSEPNNITLGSALDFDLPLVSVRPAVDLVYLNDANLQFTRKINFGVEVGLPIISLRGGFHEGYYTAGFGMNMGLFRVDAATYGVELGDYPGQIEDRRYVLQFTMKLGVGNFSATGNDKKNANGTTKDSSSSDSDSIWGGKRLKQRR